MSAEFRCHAVIPAAGGGARFGTDLPKQYQLLLGKPVLRHTLNALHALPWVDSIVLVHAPDDQVIDSSFLQDLSKVVTTTGGSERAASVLNGLWALDQEDDDCWVMVHDAVRPCVHPHDLEALRDKCMLPGVDAAILASPVRETLKKVGADNLVESTVDRSSLWQAATPQVSRMKLLRQALEAGLGNPAITDEASALELSGVPVAVVPGRPDNIKITWPQDLAMAQAILMARWEG